MRIKDLYLNILELGVSKEYLQKRLDDYRNISALMFFLGAPFAAGLWEWDYFTDPIGALNTIGLRLLFFPVFLGIGLAYKFVKDYRKMSLIATAGLLVTEIFLVEIFSRLDNGLTYGIGGFMFYCLVPTIGFLGISLRFTIPYSIICVIIPHLLSVTGFVTGFHHILYATLIYPATILTILGYIAATLNYRKRYELELTLQKESHTDSMTGAANRRAFMPLLRLEILRYQRFGNPFSLILMDIDLFKFINDKQGHPMGDRVICALVDTCTKQIRATDTVARLGGDEFAILLPQTNSSLALVLAERIRLLIESLTVYNDKNVAFQFTISMGIAEYRGSETTMEQLLSTSDNALYQAKTSGRNCVVIAA
jgi:diguanylate cyclase (GGDEF)-like protein